MATPPQLGSTRLGDLEIRIVKASPFRAELELDGSPPFLGDLGDPPSDPESPNYGEELSDWLFSADDLRDGWNRAIGAHPDGLRVRIKLGTDVAGLHGLSWEKLRAPGSGVVAAMDRTPFSRFLNWNKGAIGPARGVTSTLRILVAVANPDFVRSRYAGFDPIAEAVIRKSLSGLSGEGVEIDWLDGPCTLDAIEIRMREKQYQVLHLVGHAGFHKEKRTVLYLANDDNNVEPESEERFAEMLERLGKSLPKLVFLCACESAKQDKETAYRGVSPQMWKAGVPAVLAMQSRIAPESAYAFSAAFYKYLIRSGEVDSACNLARSARLSAGDEYASVPVLFSHLEGGALYRPEIPELRPSSNRGDEMAVVSTAKKATRAWKWAAGAVIAAGLFAAWYLKEPPSHVGAAWGKEMFFGDTKLFEAGWIWDGPTAAKPTLSPENGELQLRLADHGRLLLSPNVLRGVSLLETELEFEFQCGQHVEFGWTVNARTTRDRGGYEFRFRTVDTGEPRHRYQGELTATKANGGKPLPLIRPAKENEEVDHNPIRLGAYLPGKDWVIVKLKTQDSRIICRIQLVAEKDAEDPVRDFAILTFVDDDGRWLSRGAYLTAGLLAPAGGDAKVRNLVVRGAEK